MNKMNWNLNIFFIGLLDCANSLFWYYYVIVSGIFNQHSFPSTDCRESMDADQNFMETYCIHHSHRFTWRLTWFGNLQPLKYTVTRTRINNSYNRNGLRVQKTKTFDEIDDPLEINISENNTWSITISGPTGKLRLIDTETNVRHS